MTEGPYKHELVPALTLKEVPTVCDEWSRDGWEVVLVLVTDAHILFRKPVAQIEREKEQAEIDEMEF